MEQCLDGRQGPVIASTDYMRAFAEQIRPFVPQRYVCLGTDGFGRSDYRVALRKFFEVNRHYVVVAALKSLADEGVVPKAEGCRGDRRLWNRSGAATALDHVKDTGGADKDAAPRSQLVDTVGQYDG